MVKVLLPVLLALSSCTVPAEKRVDIVLRNDVDRFVEIRAQAGIFSKSLLLAPGETWRGWIPLQFTGGEVRVEVLDDPRVRALKSH